jgi:outer membrane protein, multidrug efflux system
MRHSFILFIPLLAGCALHEAAPKPPLMPSAFEARSAAGESWPSQDWYKGFGSLQLQTLIEQAAHDNLDLAMARARVTQADARARQAGAAILPSVDAGANGNYLAGHSANGSAHETDWAVLLSASYEIDFWGKNRAIAHSATLLAEASRADRDTLALTTLAAVADGYFHVLSLRERLKIAAANVDAARRLLDVIQARFNEGLANPVELSAQKATLATAALVVPDLKQQEEEALASLAVLLGRAPEQFSIGDESLESMVEPALGSGIPAQLLTRRPDVFMAEANMQAANANLLAARAALLPSFDLTLSGGVQNPALNAAVITLSGVGPTLNLGASIAQTIFDGGRLRAMRAESQAKDEELITAYRAAILAALVDVENALSGINHLEEARASQLESVTQSERAFEGATLRYKAGSGDFLTVLEAQRTLYAARDQYSQYKLARLEASVALCKALGGGWQAQSPALSTKDAR